MREALFLIDTCIAIADAQKPVWLAITKSRVRISTPGNPQARTIFLRKVIRI
jgi:hypothetical protein